MLLALGISEHLKYGEFWALKPKMCALSKNSGSHHTRIDGYKDVLGYEHFMANRACNAYKCIDVDVQNQRIPRLWPCIVH
jgi:hypothetical protein